MKSRRRAVVKGSSLPVLRIVVRDGDSQTLRVDLANTIEDARPLLADAIAVLDLRECASSDTDRGEIVETVREASVRLAAVLIGEPNERAALGPLDLPVIEAPLSTRDRPEADLVEEQAEATAMPPPAQSNVPGPGLAPLFITRPLRSGQRIYAQGRDAVVAAPTSRGSELIADGSIYAFSPIRGRVLAGASGDASACIVASHLDAELVAVAGVYRTLEADDLKAHGGAPVRVTLWVDTDGSERLALAPLALSSSMQPS